MSISEVLAGERPWWVKCGDALSVLKTMPDCCIHVAMTSPPYFSLRDYQTGKWEGGDSGCDHIRTTSLKRSNSGGLKPRPGDSRPGPRVERGTTAATYSSAVQFSDVCGKCGARRIDQQLGLEDCHDCQGWATGQPCGSCFICHLLAVFTEVKRVLRPDGVCVVNLSDTFASAGGPSHNGNRGNAARDAVNRYAFNLDGVEQGALLGIPWRFALAMQSQGWLLRSSVIWAKQAAMPESISGWRWERHRIKTRSVGNEANGRKRTPRTYDPAIGGQTFQQAEWEPCPGCERCSAHGGYVLRKGSWRPTRSHEHVFIFAKSDKYWCDGDAVRTPHSRVWSGNNYGDSATYATGEAAGQVLGRKEMPHGGLANGRLPNPLGANLRDVLWTDEGPLFRLRPDLTDEQLRQVAEFLEPYDNDATTDTLRLGPEPCSIACICQPSPDCPVHAGQPGPIYVDRPPPSWKRCTCERTSHFAAFPTTLCRPFLEAFCPARCCAECGTGWVRVVEQKFVPSQSLTALPKGGQKGMDASNRWGDYPRGTTESTTLGWRPACNCNSQATPVAGLCLDPFSGTGTLALTARRMGLRAIGIELSESYTILSRERLRRDNLLFSELPTSLPGPQPDPEPEPEPDLFGLLED